MWRAHRHFEAGAFSEAIAVCEEEATIRSVHPSRRMGHTVFRAEVLRHAGQFQKAYAVLRRAVEVGLRTRHHDALLDVLNELKTLQPQVRTSATPGSRFVRALRQAVRQWIPAPEIITTWPAFFGAVENAVARRRDWNVQRQAEYLSRKQDGAEAGPS